MRRTVLVLAVVLTVAALAAPAFAVPPNPNHRVIEVLGRRLVSYNHFGDPNQGHVTASAQGELVDTNFNSLADAIRGRAALLEGHGVIRFRITQVLLQVDFADTWFTVARSDPDVVSSNNPAYLVDYTPIDRYCVSDRTTLTYRVVHRDLIRWDDDTVGSRTTISNQFQARRTKNHPDCPD
jgi:hypothetical protein